MYKVLIIDDEEPARQAIKIMGEWENLEIEEILEAQDGMTGLKLLREQKPDVVLIDMRMPVMNGVEFLKISENESTDVLNIIISGYEDFEFTKQAIKSKSVDYLLKPVNRRELNEVLSKALSIIREKRKKQSEIINNNIMLNVSLPILMEKLFISVIDGIYNEQTFEAYPKLNAFINGQRCFGIALLKIMNLEEINSKCFHNDINMLYFALSNVINEIISPDLNSFSYRNPKVRNEMICIITCENTYSDKVKSLSYDLIKHAMTKLRNLFGIISFTSIGGFYSELSELRDSYKDAEKIMNSINLLSIKELAVCDVVDRGKAPSHSILSKRDLIINALEGGSLDYIQSIIADYLNEVRKTCYFCQDDAYRTLNEFVLMMNDIALEYGVSYDEISKGYEIGSGFGELNYGMAGMVDLENLLYRTLDCIYTKIKDHAKSYEGFNIYDIKEYIDKKYFEGINLSIFTEKYFFSREYLLKLFKKEFGCGIYEYLLKVRMDKAKILLNDPEIKIQSISGMLGYNDHYYFTKAFKNYNGLTPSDYRANLFKK